MHQGYVAQLSDVMQQAFRDAGPTECSMGSGPPKGDDAENPLLKAMAQRGLGAHKATSSMSLSSLYLSWVSLKDEISPSGLEAILGRALDKACNVVVGGAEEQRILDRTENLKKDIQGEVQIDQQREVPKTGQLGLPSKTKCLPKGVIDAVRFSSAEDCCVSAQSFYSDFCPTVPYNIRGPPVSRNSPDALPLPISV